MATLTRRSVRIQDRPSLRVLPGRGGAFRVALIPAALVVVLAIFAVAGLHAYLAQEGFRSARLERELREERERYVLLRAQRAELSSPARLHDAAGRLGMTEPADPVYLPAPSAFEEEAAAGGLSEAPPKHLLSEGR